MINYVIYSIVFVIMASLLLLESKKDIIAYEIYCLIVYLGAFVFVKQFDVLLVLYAVFAFLPFIASAKFSGKMLLLLFLIAFHGLFAVINSIFPSYATLVFTRYLFLFAISFAIAKRRDGHNIAYENTNRLLWIMVLSETALILLLSVVNNGAKDVFVVNHQPVVGNISICGILLSLVLLEQRRAGETDVSKLSIAIRILFCVAVCIATGIRGYIILSVPVSIYALFSLVDDKKKRSRFYVVSALTLCVIFFGILLASNGSLSNILADVDMGIGYRETENRYFIHVVRSSNVIESLFGYGIGATGAMVSPESVYAVAKTNFLVGRLLNGNTLLNIWALYWLNTGFIGFCIILVIIRELFNSIRNSSASTEFKRALIVYLIAYIFMLAFRNTVSCGIAEFLLFGLILSTGGGVSNGVTRVTEHSD